METLFTVSFRGNLVQLQKNILESLPKHSKFADTVRKQHSCELGEILQEDKTDLLIYVNRSSSLFNHILDYIEHGELHYPQYICPVIIAKELDFWGYSEQELGSCCLDRLLKDREDDKKCETISKEWVNFSDLTIFPFCHDSSSRKVLTNGSNKISNSDPCLEVQQPIESAVTSSAVGLDKEDSAPDIDDAPEGFKTRRIQISQLSEILNNPLASLPGKVWLCVIITSIAVSMLTLMLECEPRIREPSLEEFSKTTNLTVGEGLYTDYFYNSTMGLWVVFLDFACALLLTLDFIGRCLVSPRRCMFLIHPFNVIDILGIIPVWIVFVLAVCSIAQNWTLDDWKFFQRYQYIAVIFALLHLLRLFRFRLILLQFKPLRMISLAYKRSFKELFLLSVILTMASVVYGALIFFAEIFFDSADSFPSGIHAQWWAFVTMTTVGYGDHVPKTDAGFIIGASCALFGIIIVAMTTTIIIANFMQVYKNVETVERRNRYQKSLQSEKKTPRKYNVLSLCTA